MLILTFSGVGGLSGTGSVGVIAGGVGERGAVATGAVVAAFDEFPGAGTGTV